MPVSDSPKIVTARFGRLCDPTRQRGGYGFDTFTLHLSMEISSHRTAPLVVGERVAVPI